jgi:hypothetical protein
MSFAPVSQSGILRALQNTLRHLNLVFCPGDFFFNTKPGWWFGQLSFSESCRWRKSVQRRSAFDAF